jgi:hypothetical protein
MTKIYSDGFDWLVRHQSADGRWDPATFPDRCEGVRCDGTGDAADVVESTARALDAFHSGLSSHRDRGHGKSIAAGLDWLQSVQDAGGAIGPRTNSRHVIAHALATVALLDECNIEPKSRWRPSAEAAIGHLLAVRDDAGVWGASIGGAADLEATTLALCALGCARNLEFSVPAETFERPRAWLDGSHKGSPALVAARRILALYVCSARSGDPRLQEDLATLREAVPRSGGWPGDLDVEFVTAASTAAYLWGGDLLRDCKRANLETIEPTLRGADDGCARGSWDPPAAGSLRGGRVASTGRLLRLFGPQYWSTYRNAIIDKPLFEK